MSDETPLPGAPPPAATLPPPPALPKLTPEVIEWCQLNGFSGQSRSGVRKWLIDNPERLRELQAHLHVKGPTLKPGAEAAPPAPPPAPTDPAVIAMLGGMVGQQLQAVIGGALKGKRKRPPGGSVEAFASLTASTGNVLAAVADKRGWLKPEWGLELAAVVTAFTLAAAVFAAAKSDDLDDEALAKAWGDKVRA